MSRVVKKEGGKSLKSVKMLLVSGDFWVFYGSMTNGSYTITVTDTTDDSYKEYDDDSAWCGDKDLNAFEE